MTIELLDKINIGKMLLSFPRSLGKDNLPLGLCLGNDFRA
jgi:hypothetical protein